MLLSVLLNDIYFFWSVQECALHLLW